MPKPIYYGPSAPFISGSMVMPIQADERLVRNDLLQLLMTIPDERIMRPRWGVNLRNFPFEMMDDAGINELRESIADGIAKYENRVSVSTIQIDKNEETATVAVKIYGTILFGVTSTLLVELNLPFGGKSTEAR